MLNDPPEELIGNRFSPLQALWNEVNFPEYKCIPGHPDDKERIKVAASKLANPLRKVYLPTGQNYKSREPRKSAHKENLKRGPIMDRRVPIPKRKEDFSQPIGLIREHLISAARRAKHSYAFASALQRLLQGTIVHATYVPIGLVKSVRFQKGYYVISGKPPIYLLGRVINILLFTLNTFQKKSFGKLCSLMRAAKY